MKQVSYLSQIANRVPPRSDRPSANQVLLNPPRLLFRQSEASQAADWGDETPLGDLTLESSFHHPQQMSSVPPVTVQTEVITDTKPQPPTPDIVMPPASLQNEEITNTKPEPTTPNIVMPPVAPQTQAVTNTKPQPTTPNIVMPPVAPQTEAVTDTKPQLPNIDQPSPFQSIRHRINQSAFAENPQTEAKATNQVLWESAAIASPTANSTTTASRSYETIADVEAAAFQPRLNSQTDSEGAVHQPKKALQTTLKPDHPKQLTPILEIEPVGKSAPPQRPTVHIGAIEIQISPPPVTVPPPTVKTATRTAPPKTGSLSRGFTSTFGLRQG